MDTQLLSTTAKQLVAPGKGLLAADESNASCQKRFDSVGVPCTEETRREYRDILLTAPGAEQYMSGVIMYDETFWQSAKNGIVFREDLKRRNVLPGIKVDKGLVDLPGFPDEKATEGLDGLNDRMATYRSAGARFAKWRAVIALNDDTIPTDECIGNNTLSLARYARICQENGIVPIVEPEVLFDGDHTIERCEVVMRRVYDILFQTMRAFKVYMPGAILKTAMVLPGKSSGDSMDEHDIATRTANVLREHVPEDLGGVVFLSGGQTSHDALINLHRIAEQGPYPWGLTFSYSRALQDPVLKAWAENRHAVHELKQLFVRQLKLASDASLAKLDRAELDRTDFVSHAQDL